MAEALLGWDIGGAHLKAARVESGRLTGAVQIPCPLWRGLDELDAAMNFALARLGKAPRHAITMTGEMVDLFASRQQGVRALVAAAGDRLGNAKLRVFAGEGGFVAPEQAQKRWREIASANWLASAMLTAAALPEALLVDIGSTTTDVVPVAKGKVLAEGRSDSQRLARDELVYTGIVRTPIMAVASEATFDGETQGVMAELFATMADAYRVARILPEDADDFPAPDQAGKTARDSARRLARMLGRDVESAPIAAWRRFANELIEIQTTRIEAACRRVLKGKRLGAKAPLVAAGCGRFLVNTLARRLKRPCYDFADLVPTEKGARHSAGTCAPAVAVAILAFGS
ncbi:MAG TPA: hydantoinase/oxoprolinase family protein [Alphaproteobacteria bacterium]|nr:hydantoinase/oxoprolinase family protein [Alphaproteobacteria bacterium]